MVLTPEDEPRLTAWMRAHLRLTWAEDEEPVSIETELVSRLHPPLNVHGVAPEHVQAAVVAAKNAYNASRESLGRPDESRRVTPEVYCASADGTPLPQLVPRKSRGNTTKCYMLATRVSGPSPSGKAGALVRRLLSTL